MGATVIAETVIACSAILGPTALPGAAGVRAARVTAAVRTAAAAAALRGGLGGGWPKAVAPARRAAWATGRAVVAPGAASPDTAAARGVLAPPGWQSRVGSGPGR